MLNNKTQYNTSGIRKVYTCLVTETYHEKSDPRAIGVRGSLPSLINKFEIFRLSFLAGHFFCFLKFLFVIGVGRQLVCFVLFDKLHPSLYLSTVFKLLRLVHMNFLPSKTRAVICCRVLV